MFGKGRGQAEMTGTDEQNVNVTAIKRRRDETGEKGGEGYRVAKRDRWVNCTEKRNGRGNRSC